METQTIVILTEKEAESLTSILYSYMNKKENCLKEMASKIRDKVWDAKYYAH